MSFDYVHLYLCVCVLVFLCVCEYVCHVPARAHRGQRVWARQLWPTLCSCWEIHYGSLVLLPPLLTS